MDTALYNPANKRIVYNNKRIVYNIYTTGFLLYILVFQTG